MCTNHICKLVLATLFYFTVLAPASIEATDIYTCDQEICNACTTCSFPAVNISVSEIIYQSPLIGYYVSDTSEAQQIQGQCFTYIELLPGIFLKFQLNVLTDGTKEVFMFFLYETPTGPGSYWIVGLAGSPPAYSPTIAVRSTIAVPCPGDSAVFASVTVSTALGCPEAPGLIPFSGFGPSTQPDASCVSEAEDALLQYNGGQSFYEIPNTKPITCISEVYGIPVINAAGLKSNPDIQAVSFPSLEPY